MKFYFRVCAALLVLNGAVFAAPAPSKSAPKKAPQVPVLIFKPATSAQKDAAQLSIGTQLAAFRRGDWPTAVRYQSAALKRNFASAKAFETMMKTSYPQFVSSKSASFGRAFSSGNWLEIEVKVTGSDGVVVDCVYQMVKENGVYHVAGVAGGLAPQIAPGRNV